MQGSRLSAAVLSIALTAIVLTPAHGQTNIGDYNYTCDEAIMLHSYALEVNLFMPT